ncbi:FtsK/SpoIIIE domain-containing protein [Nocardia abscessus]|uniref:FtsK/SpoIIIE domain-containing protein n=1 Tax=Nocardia abscessus TaxID=120957 RepID=UPI002454991B|nr:FtsK/SpoIIIE domain-containing protein [Nocardia abscessus]
MVRSAKFDPRRDGRRVSDPATDIENMLMDALIALAYGLVLCVWWAVLFPMLSLPVVVSVGLGVWLGWPFGAVAGVVSVAGWGLWWWRWPVSFRRRVSGRIAARFRKWARYTQRWKTVTAMSGLTLELDTRVKTPAIMRAETGHVVDVLEVGMLDGQKVEDWAAKSEELRHAFRAIGLRVRHTRPGFVHLEVIHKDLLREPIPLPRDRRGAESVDLQSIPVGVTELDRPWKLTILGTHLLIAGETGSGKGSVAWSIIAALAPAIAAGTVVVWVIDPKGGVEFGLGMGWFDRFAYDNSEMALQLLRELVKTMKARMDRMRGKVRKLIPSADEPMILLIVDEFASLTEYFTDKKTRDEIERLLGLLTTQGRAAGIVVVGCIQDPSKDVLRVRQLFPTRVGLRVAEPTQVQMIFGLSGRERGALCDLIPVSMPGTAYVQITPGLDLSDAETNAAEEHAADIVRVRAFEVTDDDIRWLISTYRPPRRYTGDNPTPAPSHEAGGQATALLEKTDVADFPYGSDEGVGA